MGFASDLVLPVTRYLAYGLHQQLVFGGYLNDLEFVKGHESALRSQMHTTWRASRAIVLVMNRNRLRPYPQPAAKSTAHKCAQRDGGSRKLEHASLERNRPHVTHAEVLESGRNCQEVVRSVWGQMVMQSGTLAPPIPLPLEHGWTGCPITAGSTHSQCSVMGTSRTNDAAPTAPLRAGGTCGRARLAASCLLQRWSVFPH